MSVLNKTTTEEKIYLSFILLGIFFLLYIINFIFPLVRENKEIKQRQVKEQTELKFYCEETQRVGSDSAYPLACYRYFMVVRHSVSNTSR